MEFLYNYLLLFVGFWIGYAIRHYREDFILVDDKDVIVNEAIERVRKEQN
jgi:hypothetical protein